MTDRIPLQVASNGAVRHGIYDIDGNLIRYEYIKNEDGAAVAGTPLNKASLLSDVTATALATFINATLSEDPTINEMLSALAGSNVARITSGSYVGTGATSLSLAIPSGAKVVLIHGGGRWSQLIRGSNYAGNPPFSGTGSSAITVTWYTNSVTLYNQYDASQALNLSGTTYAVIFIG